MGADLIGEFAEKGGICGLDNCVISEENEGNRSVACD
jgi:hypothetical protein